MPFWVCKFYDCMFEIDLKWCRVHKLNSANMIRIVLFDVSTVMALLITISILYLWNVAINEDIHSLCTEFYQKASNFKEFEYILSSFFMPFRVGLRVR